MVLWPVPDVRFNFKLGQYCTVDLEKNERTYTIVSEPREPELDLFLDRTPDGFLTLGLRKLHKDDKGSIPPPGPKESSSWTSSTSNTSWCPP